MISPSLYLLAKKIHRMLVFVIIVVGFTMSLTGILLKYSFLATKFDFIDLGQVRYLHNNLSPFFSVVLILMILTGIVMYLFPLTRNK